MSRGLTKVVVREGQDQDLDLSAAVPGRYRFLGRTSDPTWASDVQSGMRAMERWRLQALLLGRIAQLGGEIRWGKKLHGLQSLGPGG